MTPPLSRSEVPNAEGRQYQPLLRRGAGPAPRIAVRRAGQGHLRARPQRRRQDLAFALPRRPISNRLRFDPAAVWVRTAQPDAFYAKLPKIALDAGAGLREISSPDDNLEAVFRYLTET